MINKSLKIAIAAALGILVSAGAQAYVGPGAGISLLGSTLGLLVAVVTALGIVILWPLRNLLKRRGRPQPTVEGDGNAGPADDG